MIDDRLRRLLGLGEGALNRALRNPEFLRSVCDFRLRAAFRAAPNTEFRDSLSRNCFKHLVVLAEQRDELPDQFAAPSRGQVAAIDVLRFALAMTRGTRQVVSSAAEDHPLPVTKSEIEDALEIASAVISTVNTIFRSTAEERPEIARLYEGFIRTGEAERQKIETVLARVRGEGIAGD